MRQAKIAILRYFLAHPDARDTVEGIEQWWLPQAQPYSVGDIEAALQDLARQHLIRVWETGAAEPVYGRGAGDLRSIEEYLHRFE